MKRKASTTPQGPASKKPTLERQGAVYGKALYGGKNTGLAPELKYNDVTFTDDATTTATVVSLTNFAAGDTALLRDGNKIAPKSLNIRVKLTNEALTQSNVVRMMVVHDRQPNNAAPTLSLVLDSQSPTGQRLVGTASRFMILCDEVIVLNADGGTGAGVQKAFWQKYLKLDPKLITSFLDGSAGEPYSNGLYLMYIGDVAAGATDCDVSGSCRLRFFG